MPLSTPRTVQALPGTAHRRLHRALRLLQHRQRARHPPSSIGHQGACEPAHFHLHKSSGTQQGTANQSSAAHIFNIQSTQPPAPRILPSPRRGPIPRHEPVDHRGRSRACEHLPSPRHDLDQQGAHSPAKDPIGIWATEVEEKLIFSAGWVWTSSLRKQKQAYHREPTVSDRPPQISNRLTISVSSVRNISRPRTVAKAAFSPSSNHLRRPQ